MANRRTGEDIYQTLNIVHILDPASQSAGVVKTALVDTKAVGAVEFLASIGTYLAGTGTGVTWKLVEGDTTADSALTDVNSADYTASSLTLCTSGSDDSNTQKIVYRGSKRYVGANITVTTGSTSALLACVAVCGNNEKVPVSTLAAVTRT